MRLMLLSLALGVGLSNACRPSVTAQQVTPDMDALWRDPIDLEERDLFDGPGGSALAAKSDERYEFLEEKSGGVSPGYDVTDVTGQRWSVKLGAEARTEVVMSRIVWAVGYHQPIVYFVPRWTLSRDGRDTVLARARFRLEPKSQDKRGEWSWRENPFLGTRQLGGLYVLMVLFNNWDLKTAQNAIYEVTGERAETETWYMVRDLGASLGKSAWLTFGTKEDAAGFQKQPFITAVYRNRVRFASDGGWTEPQLHGSVTPGDVRWICTLLSRLSDEQWRDAFRAAGYSETEATPFIRRLKEKVDEGRRIQG